MLPYLNEIKKELQFQNLICFRLILRMTGYP